MTKCEHCGRVTDHPAFCRRCNREFCPRCTDEWQCPKCGAGVLVNRPPDGYMEIKTRRDPEVFAGRENLLALLRVLNRRS